MKQLLLACAVVLLFACKNTNEKEKVDDSTQRTENTDHSTPDTTTGNNAMMQMHDAMHGMMEQMKSMQPTGDADHDFAMMMKPHHEAAVKMAQAELAGGTDADVKAKAQKIIDDQQKEIKEFDNFLSNTRAAGKSGFGKNAMGMMTDMSAMKMESSSIDAMFLSMMIPHHEDAIKMSQAYLKEGKNEKLKAIANNIIKSQQAEIAAFQDWLAKHKK